MVQNDVWAISSFVFVLFLCLFVCLFFYYGQTETGVLILALFWIIIHSILSKLPEFYFLHIET